MSSKINIVAIVSGHFATLSDTKNSFSIPDFLTFIFLPVVLAGFALGFEFNLNKDIASLLVNFSAIFTALLLTVLMLVYDQENKLDERKRAAEVSKESPDIFFFAKKKLLLQLYTNICYCIVCSLFLIGFCFMHSVLDAYAQKVPVGDKDFSFLVSKLFITPIVVFLIANLLLTITMIVKRIHSFLLLGKE